MHGNNCSTWEIISSIASAVAAIMALITTIQNRNANIKMDEERLAAVKPIFLINSVSEFRIEHRIDIGIKNIGYERLGKINVIWEGPKDIEVNLTRVLNNNKNDKDYIINVNYNKAYEDGNNIIGKLTLLYYNIYNKKYYESIDIFLKANIILLLKSIIQNWKVYIIRYLNKSS